MVTRKMLDGEPFNRLERVEHGVLVGEGESVGGGEVGEGENGAWSIGEVEIQSGKGWQET